MPSRNAKKGLFIAFEGGEGGGKSTQIRRLSRWLKRQGYPVVLTREPGGTRVGQAIRHLILHPSQPLCPRAEVYLYVADRAQHVEERILPALQTGKIVVTDRFADSSTVYQGMCRGLGKKWVEELNRFATEGLTPDLTILLDLPETVGLRRIRKRRTKPDRLESEGRRFHQKVRRGFLALAKRHPQRYVVIDASLDEVSVAGAIQQAVFKRLKRQP